MAAQFLKEEAMLEEDLIKHEQQLLIEAQG